MQDFFSEITLFVMDVIIVQGSYGRGGNENAVEVLLGKAFVLCTTK